MKNLKESNEYRRLAEKIPTNYFFFLRNDKQTALDTYKDDFNYCIILIDSRTQKPADIRIVKTVATLEKFLKDKHIRHDLDILFHPNHIKLTSYFWQEYRQVRSRLERLAVFSKYVDTITIDIDSPFKKAIQILNDLTKELNIPAEILEVRKTKSGNLRFSFSISPIKPNSLNKNGKTNLQNIKKFVSIINEYFKIRGLKADDSFKRVNHPVWITKPEQLVFEDIEEIIFYTLYRKAKEYIKNKKQRGTQKTKRRSKTKKEVGILASLYCK